MLCFEGGRAYKPQTTLRAKAMGSEATGASGTSPALGRPKALTKTSLALGQPKALTKSLKLTRASSFLASLAGLGSGDPPCYIQFTFWHGFCLKRIQNSKIHKSIQIFALFWTDPIWQLVTPLSCGI